ncbi:MAG: hypothetical protein NC541_08930 [bacterium]|nr:hypothetical protein [bacterium]
MEDRKGSVPFWMEIISLFSLTSFFFLTTGYQSGLTGRWHFGLLFGAICLHVFSQNLLIKKGKKEIIKQLSVLNAGIAFVFLILGIKEKEVFQFFGRKSYLISCLVIAVCCLGLWIQGLRYCKEKTEKKLKDRKFILLLLVIVCALAIWNSSAEARWDGAFLYKYMQQLNITAIFNVNSLSFCNHISMAYVAVNLMAGVLFGNLKLGMTVLNIGLYLASVWSIYLVLRMKTKSNDGEAALFSAIYAFSPFLLGLVNYNYWDYWVIVIFPILFYFCLSKKWVFFIFFSLIFCFVKETAVIAYAFLCLGLLLNDLFQSVCGKSGKWNCLKRVLRKKEYYGMLAVGLSWLYVYVKLPNWDGVGAFSFDKVYILDKLAVFLGLNFNWLLAVCGIIFVVFLAHSKKTEFIKMIFPLLCSDLAFIVFSCWFKTVNHARYIDTHIAVLNLIVIVSLAMLSNKLLKYGVAVILTGIMLISNYRTVDPVTLSLFEKHNVGETFIVNTQRGEYLSDAIVYNQQYMSFDKALNKALTDAVSEENVVICFPAMNGSSWFFDGTGDWDSMQNGILVKEEYWDQDKKKRVAYEGNDYICMQIYHLSTESNLKEITGNKVGYFFYLPEVGEDIRDSIKENMYVMEEKFFEYQGWVIGRIQFANL